MFDVHIFKLIRNHIRLTFILLLLFVMVSASAQVVINEVCTSPDQNPQDFSFQSTANANSLYSVDPDMIPSYNREYVELYNTHPCDTIDISCYTLGSNANSSSSGDNWGAFTFPQGTKIPPLGFIIVGGNNAQVPFLDFSITAYRNSSFNIQYLTGDNTRWFLRDQWGWIALYNTQGNPVDAVYWNGYPGTAASLFAESEYQNNIVVSTACGGTQVLASASSIPGIEYVGNVIPGAQVSFQRSVDGSNTWFASPVTPTPRACNGPCVKPQEMTAQVQNENCGNGDGKLNVSIVDNGTGPYTYQWSHDTTLQSLNLTNLSSGPYILTVTDDFDCFIVTDTFWVQDDAGPNITYNNIINESCSNSNGLIEASITGGTAPYQVEWNTSPVQNSLTISNLSEGEYVIEVSDANNCINTDTIRLENHKEPVLSVDILAIDSCLNCRGIAMANVIGDDLPYNYSWSSNAAVNDSVIGSLCQGNHIITISDGICDASLSFNMPGLAGPVADFYASPWEVYVEDGWINFYDQSVGSVVGWEWNFGDGFTSGLQNPAHQYTELNTYPVSLMVEDANGCTDSVFYDILVKDISSAFFPNAFTPDGDGLNDVFKPVNIYLTNYRISIFNRWGQKVFESTDPDYGWDGMFNGTMAPTGVYTYISRFTHDYGDNITKDLKLMGTVLLIRGTK
jgi:gliding motility-associated-like protein